jgi:hypothetical protein
MKITITENQFNTLKDGIQLEIKFPSVEDCVVALQKLLNNVNTKKIFEVSINTMLDVYRKKLSPNSEQYKEDSKVLKKYFGFDSEKIDKVMGIRMIYDENDNWIPINKLNTNYSDLSVLVTDILIDKEENICELVESFEKGDMNFLKKLAVEIEENPDIYYNKYLKDNFDKYVVNNRINTNAGNESESFVISELEKLGYEKIYQTSEGSPIDTKLSVDLIMEKNLKIYKIQVKSVGSLTDIPTTPCDITNPNIKQKGGVKVFKKNIISFTEKYVDYLVFVAPTTKKMVVLKKYQPVSIEKTKPLKCVAIPIDKFPMNNIYIDHESIVYKNF